MKCHIISAVNKVLYIVLTGARGDLRVVAFKIEIRDCKRRGNSY